MKLAISKADLESELDRRFGPAFKLRDKPATEVMPTGILEVDRITGGLPRGAITEIIGPESSGRTSLLHSTLAAATVRQEVCALVDANDTFDATSAAAAGADFDQLLWIRCASKVEHAIKATDLLLQGGGFGLVALDFGDVPAAQSRRIQLSWWFRFKRALENKPTALLLISRDPNAKSCAALVLELNMDSAQWSRPADSSSPHEPKLPTCSTLLRSLSFHVERNKPMSVNKRKSRFQASAFRSAESNQHFR